MSRGLSSADLSQTKIWIIKHAKMTKHNWKPGNQLPSVDFNLNDRLICDTTGNLKVFFVMKVMCIWFRPPSNHCSLIGWFISDCVLVGYLSGGPVFQHHLLYITQKWVVIHNRSLASLIGCCDLICWLLWSLVWNINT